MGGGKEADEVIVRCNTVHLDAVGGAAGDMFVAAMLDCLPQLRARVFSDIAAVLPGEAGTPFLEAGLSSGLRVQRFGLRGHHRGHHQHADYRSLRARIEKATLAEGTAAHACAILEILAQAEARMHAIALEDVHFHEVGDWDSLMDVVAAGNIAAALSPCRWTVSTLPRGAGLVETAHGRLPVPAPATLEILEGFEWRDDGVSGERVTPTGAAILRHLCTEDSGFMRPAGRLLAAGMGAGTRDLPGMANILRATAFEAVETVTVEEIAVLSFDIDDMTGEEVAVAADRLRALDGVADLTLMQLSGKKGRPVCRFELLVAPARVEPVSDECFRQTSTIGLRWRRENRKVLERTKADKAGTPVKVVRRPGNLITAKAESDSLRFGETLAERRDRAGEATTGYLKDTEKR